MKPENSVCVESNEHPRKSTYCNRITVHNRFNFDFYEPSTSYFLLVFPIKAEFFAYLTRVRRQTPRTLHGRKHGGLSPSVYVRGGMIVIATIFGASMLVSLFKTQSPSLLDVSDSLRVPQVRDSVHLRIAREREGSLPADLHRIKMIGSKNDVEPPLSIPKYDHHLEEPDIHMHIAQESKPASIGEKKLTSSRPDVASAQPNHQLVANKKGTGPTKVAYVNDVAGDRLHPVFGKVAIDGSGKSDIVASKVQKQKVAPCLKLESIGGYHRWTKEAQCLEADTPQIAYNTASFPRVWCEQEIGPGAAVIMRETCNDPIVQLFGTKTASPSGRGMPPMILQNSESITSVLDASSLQSVDCDIPCLQQPATASGLVSRISFAGESWTIQQTMVEPSVNPNAHVERTNYRLDVFYSTPCFKSDVPLTLYDPIQFSLRNRPAVSYDKALPKAVYMVNGVCSPASSRRNKYVSTLHIKGFPVVSMGECDHNADVPQGMSIETSEGRIAIMKNYRFVLAFDQTNDKDYISTMVWEALVSGSVPVVVGADNLRNHLPLNSFVDSGSYGATGWEEMADAVIDINESREKWESYHAWRTDEAELAKFESLYEFSKTNPTCRLCRWGYAKKYGLGWDHTSQRVTETRLSRALCTTETSGLASKPFQEEWISRNEENDIAVRDEGGTEKCSTTAVSTIDNRSTYKVERSLLEHDGIIDLIVNDIQRESTMQELVLRLNFVGLRNSDGASFRNTHTLVKDLTHGPVVSSMSIQDDFSKVTILTDWVTSITSPAEGVVEIVVLEQHENEEQPKSPLSPIPKRVRVIVEDMDVVNDKMTEYFPSPFAKRVIKDFVDPLEIYYAVT
jgi:hypothetical protein